VAILEHFFQFFNQEKSGNPAANEAVVRQYIKDKSTRNNPSIINQTNLLIRTQAKSSLRTISSNELGYVQAQRLIGTGAVLSYPGANPTTSEFTTTTAVLR
jgi:hypothetical protein